MIMKSLKLTSFICIILFITLTHVIQVQASSQTDPLDDVVISGSLGIGDYADYIDLKQVEIQGSTIIIMTDGDLTNLSSGTSTYLMALLSDDGNPMNFEAMILISHPATGQDIVYWMIGDPLTDVGIEWESSYSGTHSQIDNNILQLFFLEYYEIVQSEALVVTFTGGSQYFDWTPNTYHSSYINTIIDTISSTLPVIVASPPPPTTTTPPPPPPTTITSTITTSNINPVIITTTTKETTTEETFSTTSSSPPSPTSGFLFISIILLTPLIILMKRRKKN